MKLMLKLAKNIRFNNFMKLMLKLTFLAQQPRSHVKKKIFFFSIKALRFYFLSKATVVN